MEKKLIYGAIAKPTRYTPLHSCIRMYRVDKKDCFGDSIILVVEQVYQRKNKNLDGKKSFNIISDFNGAKGITEEFHDMEEIGDFLEMTIDDGYQLRRLTEHGENELADEMFQKVMSHSMSKQRFLLPV